MLCYPYVPQLKMVGNNRKVFSAFWIGLYMGHMHQTVSIDIMVHNTNIAITIIHWKKLKSSNDIYDTFDNYSVNIM